MILRMDQFSQELAGLGDARAPELAAGVSGGPDSMALLWLLSSWASERGGIVHALIVDHGLRPESAAEAAEVCARVKDWPQVRPVILRWEGEKPQTRILEEARAARYALMEEYMRSRGLRHLLVAHHQDDQAETFLLRLCAGSGLDGLTGMGAVQEKEGGILLMRPLLSYTKDDLIRICDESKIPYVLDPTNQNDSYARPRLRAARDVLEEEGLSAKRLCVTAARLSRARDALDGLTNTLWEEALREEGPGKIVFDFNVVGRGHEELVLRLCLKAAARLSPARRYAPRLERMEELVARLLRDNGFKSATLGGCLFALARKNAILSIETEE